MLGLLLTATVTVHASWLDSAAKSLEQGLDDAASGVEKVTSDIGRAALDATVRSSGKCPTLSKGRRKIAPLLAPRFAAGFQESGEAPGSDQERCIAIVRAAIVGFLHEAWHDPTGVSDKIVEGLSGEILPQICATSLMRSLKENEAKRRTDPPAYKEALQKTLLEEVLTDAWLQRKIQEHCGGLQDTRLYAKETHIAEFLTKGAQGAAPATGVFAGLVIIAGMVIAAKRRASRPQCHASGAGNTQQELEWVE